MNFLSKKDLPSMMVGQGGGSNYLHCWTKCK